MIDSCIAALWHHGYDLIRKISTQGMDYIMEKCFELLRQVKYFLFFKTILKWKFIIILSHLISIFNFLILLVSNII